jgi:hypothetical protein
MQLLFGFSGRPGGGIRTISRHFPVSSVDSGNNEYIEQRRESINPQDASALDGIHENTFREDADVSIFMAITLGVCPSIGLEFYG